MNLSNLNCDSLAFLILEKIELQVLVRVSKVDDDIAKYLTSKTSRCLGFRVLKRLFDSPFAEIFKSSIKSCPNAISIFKYILDGVFYHHENVHFFFNDIFR